MTPVECYKAIDEHLNKSHQIWLLGAGISRESGIPLMYPLTDRVRAALAETDRTTFQTLRGLLDPKAHVETVLTHVVNLIAVAEATVNKNVDVGGTLKTVDDLRALHRKIQEAIKEVIRWGYVAAEGGAPERIGTSSEPIVTVDNHSAFAQAFFAVRRRHQDSFAPVAFFTTNYDTLLEDALALTRIPYLDGFNGGSLAFWNPDAQQGAYRKPFERIDHVRAKIYKLHGSIDWFEDKYDVVVRLRENCIYPPTSTGNLLIYPASTKYAIARREPFLSAFSAFRDALNITNQGLIAVCGYSFGDDHITDEIERSLMNRGNEFTLLAFAYQQEGAFDEYQNLPPRLARLLAGPDQEWAKRVFVCGSRGFYHGTLANQCPPNDGQTHAWWSFRGVTQLLRDGRL
jgi:hypothetical protein